MNINDYISANSWGYDVAKASQTTGTKYTPQISSQSFTIPTQSENATKTEKISTANNDPFKEMARTGSSTLPEWMNTKTEPTRSDAEILKELMELAKEHSKSESPVNVFEDERYLKLMDEYISSVSPDRAGILNQSAKEINGIINAMYGTDYSLSEAYQQLESQRTDKTNEESKEKKSKELIDYFIEALKKDGRHNDIKLDMINDEITDSLTMLVKSDMYEGVIENGNVQSMEFFDADGNSVMIYEDGKFLQAIRPEETSRRVQAWGAYEAAYDFAAGESRQLDPYPSEFKEAYNGTYARLTNSTLV
jgi:hypothetical protein